MAKQISQILEVSSPETVPETVVTNLFDIDPYAEQKRRVHVDLKLDQLENYDDE